MTDQGVDVGGVQEAAKQKAAEVVGQAQQVGETIQERVVEETDARSTQAGEQVGSLGGAMRDASEQLRGQGNDLPAALTAQVADRVDQFGRYLRETDGRQIIDDVQDFAREQPWLVAAVGLVAGIAAARLLKASARNSTQPGTRAALPTPAPTPAPQASGYDPRAEDVVEARYAPVADPDIAPTAPPPGVAQYPGEERR